MSGGGASSPLELLRARQVGNISREEYWRAMRRRHATLREYQALLAGGAVRGIEIRRDALVVALDNSLRFVWDPEDIRTAPSLLVNEGAYEAAEMAVLERLVPRCRVVLDVGANVGWYAVHFARMMQAHGGKVVAFEPVPATCATLRRNVALNRMEEAVEVVACGLGETEGEMPLFVPQATGSVAASRRPILPEEGNTRVVCAMSTMDRFAAERGLERIDFIKCDIEGAEIFALRGGLRTIRRCLPAIMMELLRKWCRTYGYHPNDVVSLLGGLGYECLAAEGGSVRVCREIAEDCPQTNFFFLHPDKHGDWYRILSAG